MGRAHARRTGLVRLAAGTATALIMSDLVATTLAVPLLSRDPLASGLDVAQLALLTTLNLAVPASALAASGRLADLVGYRLMLALGLAMYALGAAIVIAATSWPLLVAGRAVGGFGGAIMFPAALALLLDAVGPNRRAAAMVGWTACSGLGAVAMNGGSIALISAFGWRALYAPGLLMALLVLLLIPALPRPAARDTARPDLLGALMAVVGLFLLMVTLAEGGRWGWLSPTTAATVGGSMTLLAAVLRRSRWHPGAAWDARLWRLPGLAWGGLITAIATAITYGLLLVLPLRLVDLGVDAREVGLWLAPMAAAGIVASPLAGAACRRYGPIGVIYLGALLLGAGCTLLSTLGASANLWLVGASVAAGAGSAVLFTAAGIAGNRATPPERYGAAVGALATTRVLGGSLGVALASLVLTHPFVPLSDPGYGSVLVLAVLGCALVAVVALVTSVRQALARPVPRPAFRPEPFARPQRPAVPEVVRPPLPRRVAPVMPLAAPVPEPDHGLAARLHAENATLRTLLHDIRADLAQAKFDAEQELLEVAAGPLRPQPPAPPPGYSGP